MLHPRSSDFVPNLCSRIIDQELDEKTQVEGSNKYISLQKQAILLVIAVHTSKEGTDIHKQLIFQFTSCDNKSMYIQHHQYQFHDPK